MRSSSRRERHYTVAVLSLVPHETHVNFPDLPPVEFGLNSYSWLQPPAMIRTVCGHSSMVPTVYQRDVVNITPCGRTPRPKPHVR